jgi:hypothetical protein
MLCCYRVFDPKMQPRITRINTENRPYSSLPLCNEEVRREGDLCSSVPNVFNRFAEGGTDLWLQINDKLGYLVETV